MASQVPEKSSPFGNSFPELRDRAVRIGAEADGPGLDSIASGCQQNLALALLMFVFVSSLHAVKVEKVSSRNTCRTT